MLKNELFTWEYDFHKTSLVQLAGITDEIEDIVTWTVMVEQQNLIHKVVKTMLRKLKKRGKKMLSFYTCLKSIILSSKVTFNYCKNFYDQWKQM